MNNLALICFARKNSTRFPGKNVYPLNGKPLIQYTIDTMKFIRDRLFCKVVIFTDFEKCFNIAVNNKILCIVNEEKCNYDDMRLHEWAADFFISDNFILLQPTNPIRDNDKILEWTSFCLENNVASAFSAYRESPLSYKMNGNFYFYNKKQLSKEKIYDEKSIIFQDKYFFDIDTKKDLLKTEEYLKNENKNNR